jgi:hypothetical protein
MLIELNINFFYVLDDNDRNDDFVGERNKIVCISIGKHDHHHHHHHHDCCLVQMREHNPIHTCLYAAYLSLISVVLSVFRTQLFLCFFFGKRKKERKKETHKDEPEKEEK